jgi:hypothetical protein
MEILPVVTTECFIKDKHENGRWTTDKIFASNACPCQGRKLHTVPNTGYTQKNGAVSKANKKFISHLTRAKLHRQQRQLSKFLMR